MIEKTISVPFEALKAIRVTCKCRTTIELPLDKLQKLPSNCPACDKQWSCEGVGDEKNPLPLIRRFIESQGNLGASVTMIVLAPKEEKAEQG
jgi:hypothetical protein